MEKCFDGQLNDFLFRSLNSAKIYENFNEKNLETKLIHTAASKSDKKVFVLSMDDSFVWIINNH